MRNLKIFKIAMMVITVCHISFSKDTDKTKLTLIPSPQKIEYKKGHYIPEKKLILTVNAGLNQTEHGTLDLMARTCSRDLSVIGFSVSHGEKPPPGKTNIIHLKLLNDASLGNEGYRLAIDKHITIKASTSDGLFWGTRTLLQILDKGPLKSIPRLMIMDKPEFGHRGVLIDNARQFHSIDFHVDMLKRLASFKLNRYHLHFSDYQSYTLPSSKFPSLPTQHRHFTTTEVEQLTKTAREYHVMIVPEIDVPGHATALTRGMSELNCSDVSEGESARKICIGKESTYHILETLFSEVMEMIPGEYWHLGADEVSYDACTCEDCLKKMEQENFEHGYQLYHYFINRMYDFVKSKGRKMFVWEGFHPNENPIINKEIIVCPFDVKFEGHMPEDYFQAGYCVLNTSWSPLYVADRIYMTTPEIIALWSPFMFGAGRSPQPFKYWIKFNPDDVKDKIIGAQMCSWEIEEKAEEGLLFGTGPGFPEYGRPGPRVQIMAERVWSGSRLSAKELLEAVGAEYW
jgi:hexosaminidase